MPSHTKGWYASCVFVFASILTEKDLVSRKNKELKAAIEFLRTEVINLRHV